MSYAGIKTQDCEYTENDDVLADILVQYFKGQRAGYGQLTPKQVVDHLKTSELAADLDPEILSEYEEQMNLFLKSHLKEFGKSLWLPNSVDLSLITPLYSEENAILKHDPKRVEIYLAKSSRPPPIIVQFNPNTFTYDILDGRHRYLVAMAKGRPKLRVIMGIRHDLVTKFLTRDQVEGLRKKYPHVNISMSSRPAGSHFINDLSLENLRPGKILVEPETKLPTGGSRESIEQLFAELSQFGAPIRTVKHELIRRRSLNGVIQASLRSGPFKPQLTSILPIVLVKNASFIDFDLLIETSDLNYLGFLLDMAFEMSGNRSIMNALLKLSSTHRTLRDHQRGLYSQRQDSSSRRELNSVALEFSQRWGIEFDSLIHFWDEPDYHTKKIA